MLKAEHFLKAVQISELLEPGSVTTSYDLNEVKSPKQLQVIEEERHTKCQFSTVTLSLDHLKLMSQISSFAESMDSSDPETISTGAIVYEMVSRYNSPDAAGKINSLLLDN